jgi:hypothetical protein
MRDVATATPGGIGERGAGILSIAHAVEAAPRRCDRHIRSTQFRTLYRRTDDAA